MGRAGCAVHGGRPAWPWGVAGGTKFLLRSASCTTSAVVVRACSLSQAPLAGMLAGFSFRKACIRQK